MRDTILSTLASLSNPTIQRILGLQCDYSPPTLVSRRSTWIYTYWKHGVDRCRQGIDHGHGGLRGRNNLINFRFALPSVPFLFPTLTTGNAEHRQVLIARTFGWFHDDFGASDKDLLAWILPYLRDSSLQADLVECLNDLQYEVRCGHWNFDLNLWDRPLPEVADEKGVLVYPCSGFRREAGTERISAIRLFGQDVSVAETHLYRTHFHGRYFDTCPDIIGLSIANTSH